MSKKLAYMASQQIPEEIYKENPKADYVRNMENKEYIEQLKRSLQAILEVAEKGGEVPDISILESMSIAVFSIAYIIDEEDEYLLDIQKSIIDIVVGVRYYNLIIRNYDNKFSMELKPVYIDADQEVLLMTEDLEEGKFEIVISTQDAYDSHLNIKSSLPEAEHALLKLMKLISDIPSYSDIQYDLNIEHAVLEDVFKEQPTKSYLKLLAYDGDLNKWTGAYYNA